VPDLAYPIWLQDLPEERDLVTCLSAVLTRGGSGDEVTLLERIRNDYASTFPSEIVRCSARGRELRLLCKYGTPEVHRSWGHRRGVGYEAEVYSRLLEPLALRTPVHYGNYAAANGETWVVVEFIEGLRADDVASPEASMRAAARWSGRFHAEGERRLAGGELDFLSVYDGEYFAQWPRRLSAIAGDWHQRLPWLRAACERLEGALVALAEAPATAIHGEYTPHNVIASADDQVCPVDWESAAVGPGEIDIASLTQSWPAAMVEACESEYRRARWPDGEPDGFEETLDLARAYWELRWLGDRPEWLRQAKLHSRFENLRSLSARLGLLEEVPAR
jgi:hypothetical protein